ncbi:hypothetical protein OROMI_030335 [Orobanche minor]
MSSFSSWHLLNIASKLIKDQQVEAIVGSLSWQDAALLAEMNDNSSEIPIISLLAPPTNPLAIPAGVNPVIRMVPDISSQFRCIADIVSYLQCTKVSVIYEDRNTYAPDLSIITLLSDVLRPIDAEIEQYSVFPALSSLVNAKHTIREELKKLFNGQCRGVYIVAQSSLPFAVVLFEQAKQLGMMDKGNVWIIGDEINSLLDSLHSRRINSMEGVVGCRTYFSESTESFRAFKAKFIRRFLSEYPQDIEENPDPSIFALLAYDSIWTVAKAMRRLREQETLLSNILLSNFNGLSGNIRFDNYTTMDVPIFCIVNVIGKRYRELGFWSTMFGFLHNPVRYGSTTSADEVLGSAYWPGGGKSSVVGRSVLESKSSTSEQKFMRILVPKSNYSQLVRFVKDGKDEYEFKGFAVDVFSEALSKLPYALQYEFIPFSGSHDAIVQMIYRKEFDAAVGDMQTKTEWSRLVEFTQPYIDTSLVMVMPRKPVNSLEPWVLMRPFTKVMWFLLASMSFFTGFVIWVIEHRIGGDFGGPPMQQVGKVLWFSFTTLYLGQQRESLKRSLSRIVMVPWLFLILIVTASFMANLTSMITTSRLISPTVDVGSLMKTNAAVGCDGSVLVSGFLTSVLNFRPERIKDLATVDDIAKALTAGQIQAAFMLSPHAKIFLAQYCMGFTTSGPAFNLGGFSFVFPRNSTVGRDLSEGIQILRANGNVDKLEDEMISLIKCTISETMSDPENQSLGPKPFSYLFILSGGVSAVALFVSVAGLFADRFQIIITRRRRFSTVTRLKDFLATYVAVLHRKQPECASISNGSSLPQGDQGNVSRLEIM